MALRFCPPPCMNMLYPRENKQLRVLEYACQSCKYTEQVDPINPHTEILYIYNMFNVFMYITLLFYCLY